MFQKLFGFPRHEAERLMMDVHTKGKAVVASGPRERCEAHVAALARLRPMGHPAAGPMSARAKITTSYGGGVDVVLPARLRDLLSSLARQLAELIDDPEAAGDPGLQRLFPAASMDDPMEALGFEQLMGDALRQGKREAAAVLRATAERHPSERRGDAGLDALHQRHPAASSARAWTSRKTPTSRRCSPTS